MPVTINTKATPEQQGEALAGRHEDHMLIVIDEASGIPDPVFKPIEKTLTGKLNLVFMIFNPTQNTGFAIRSQNEHASKWVCKHWSGLDSENVTRASISNLAVYGKDSPDYRIGVLGQPPLADSRALIPYPWIQAAIGREFDNEGDPIMGAADVGGGGDASVCGYRKGGRVYPPKVHHSKDTMATADWVLECADEMEFDVCHIDIVAIGRGVYDYCRRQRRIFRPADARATASDEKRWANMRAEVAWRVREQFEQGLISLPEPVDPRDSNDPIVRLIRELGAIKFPEGNGPMQLPGKKELRKQLGFSTDFFDWLMMTYWRSDTLFRKSHHTKRKEVDFKGVFLR